MRPNKMIPYPVEWIRHRDGWALVPTVHPYYYLAVIENNRTNTVNSYVIKIGVNHTISCQHGTQNAIIGKENTVHDAQLLAEQWLADHPDPGLSDLASIPDRDTPLTESASLSAETITAYTEAVRAHIALAKEQKELNQRITESTHQVNALRDALPESVTAMIMALGDLYEQLG